MVRLAEWLFYGVVWLVNAIIRELAGKDKPDGPTPH